MEILILIAGLGVVLAAILILINNDPVTKAQKLEYKGLTDDALAIYRKIAAEQPENTAILPKLASILVEKKEYAEAIPLLHKGLAPNTGISPEQRTDLLLKLGRSLFHVKQFKAAFSLLQEMEAAGTADPKSLMYMGIIALKMNASREAVRYLERVESNIKEDFELHFALALGLTKEERYKEALDCFHKAEMQRPNDVRIRLLAGLTATLDQQPMRAGDLLEPIARDTSAEPEFRYAAKRGLAFVMMLRGKTGDAENTWKALAELVKTPPLEQYHKEVLYDSGFFYLSQGDAKHAVSLWKTLQDLYPDFPGVDELLAALEHKPSEEDNQEENDAALPRTSQYVNPRKQEIIDWRKAEAEAGSNEKGSRHEETGKLIDEWKIRALNPATILEYSGMLETSRFDIHSLLKNSNTNDNRGDAIDALMNAAEKEFDAAMKKVITQLGYEGYTALGRTDSKTALADGFDALAARADKSKTLIQTRRWKQATIGDMPLKDMQGKMEELGCQQGVFITTAGPGPAALKFIEKHKNIRFISGEELNTLVQTGGA